MTIKFTLKPYYPCTSCSLHKPTRYLFTVYSSSERCRPRKIASFVRSHAFVFQGKFLQGNVTGGVIVGNQTLAIQKVRRDQAGLYNCVASNTEGDGESNALYLDVKYAPSCKTGQRVIYGTASKSSARYGHSPQFYHRVILFFRIQ